MIGCLTKSLKDFGRRGQTKQRDSLRKRPKMDDIQVKDDTWKNCKHCTKKEQRKIFIIGGDLKWQEKTSGPNVSV